ncbi:MAG: hypothetical protein R3B90_05085 [Planctomycetaceae bacterium]
MHVLGKVLLGFVVVGAIAAIVLTTMTLDVRKKWQEQILQARTEYDSIAERLANARAIHRQEQEALDRVKQGWGDVFQGNANVGNPQVGAVTVGVGQDRGLGAASTTDGPNPIVHGFVVNGDQTEYVGPFEIRTAQAGSTDLTMKPAPFQGQQIPGGVWRIREEIPFDYHSMNIKLHTEQIAAEDKVRQMTAQLVVLREQLAASRLYWGSGSTNCRGDLNLVEANELQKAGYVQAIRDRLTERDLALVQLQSLRLELRLKLESLEDLMAQNQSRLAKYREVIQANAAGTSSTTRTASTAE